MFSNVITKMPADTLLAGYIRVLETLYDPDRFFERCREHLLHWRPAPGLVRTGAPGDLLVVWRSIRAQGIFGSYRRAYWRFLGWVARHTPTKLPVAIAFLSSPIAVVTWISLGQAIVQLKIVWQR